jgi:hypothetical protein
MTLLDIFKDLTYGELKGLAIGNLDPEDNESQPDPKVYTQIISHLNRGLTKIFTRFFLSSQEIYIEQVESISEYFLDSRYAQSNTGSTEPTKYIADSVAHPFLDDVLKVEQVYDEAGCLLFLNDPTEELSLYSPTARSIQIPWPNEFNTVAVQYRASHPRVSWDIGTDADLVEVKVPEALYLALLYFIAARATPLPVGQDSATNFMQLYEMECKTVETYGMQIQPEVGPWRFDAHGWV